MFPRNAKAVLIFVSAMVVSNGSMLLSPPFHSAQGHLAQDHEYRQSNRPISFGSEATDRWLLYAKDDDIGEPPFGPERSHFSFDHPPYRSTWKKRGFRLYDGPPAGHHKYKVFFPRTRPAQRLLWTPRKHRMYDVPQIECPGTKGRLNRFACPSPDRAGRYKCINDHGLCDGFIDCPNGEDEERQACMFYKVTKSHLDVVASVVLKWAEGR